MKPDAQLPGDLKGGQCLAVVAQIVVRGAVTGDTDLVEEIERLGGNARIEAQAAQ